jgi:hypothetical protein
MAWVGWYIFARLGPGPEGVLIVRCGYALVYHGASAMAKVLGELSDSIFST